MNTRNRAWRRSQRDRAFAKGYKLAYEHLYGMWGSAPKDWDRELVYQSACRWYKNRRKCSCHLCSKTYGSRPKVQILHEYEKKDSMEEFPALLF